MSDVFPAPPLPAPDPAPGTAASYDEPDEPGPGQRWSTWDDIGVLAGPEPFPAWLVTSDAAIDTELGILKTGKEADVFLLERADADSGVVLAAKRYRSLDHRLFSRDAGYTEGRRMRNSRDRRAAAKGTRHGRAVQAGQWAAAEFDHLARFWSAGLPVPYPVQLDGTELLMELITLADGSGAPRLAQTRPGLPLLETYWAQLVEAMRAMATMGLAHGDLSPFNLLATEDRLVLIDLPQAVDVVANPQGTEYLARDCRNVTTWFRARGLDVDADELLADLLAYAF
ncbi:serine protein kinase RIO [Microlunatus antarcticus]|uniref:non-specific serine/threonine protein kinase n=1 Tax=Microlunatus antarcticus TaxID=53388 RepID=A0A7W5P8W6_9ACTN|nr:RIO1 family regulatory kinase/ATPase [Microlunatus antarcticus]MBB3328311.1 RIO kinase 1 [Microlunatus antarcticus]